MEPGSVSALRGAVFKAIRDELAERLGAHRVCVEVHDGDFRESELRRVFASAPAVLVSVLGFPELRREGPAVVCDARLAVFVITSGADPRERGDEAMDLAELVARIVERRPWDGGPVSQFVAHNLYSGTVDDEGVALWSITWRQSFDLAREGTQLYHRLVVKYDIVPADGTIDAEDHVVLTEEQPDG